MCFRNVFQNWTHCFFATLLKSATCTEKNSYVYRWAPYSGQKRRRNLNADAGLRSEDKQPGKAAESPTGAQGPSSLGVGQASKETFNEFLRHTVAEYERVPSQPRMKNKPSIGRHPSTSSRHTGVLKWNVEKPKLHEVDPSEQSPP